MCLHRLLGWAKVFVFVGWVDRMGSQNFGMGLKFYEKQNVHALTWIKFLKIFVFMYFGNTLSLKETDQNLS